MKPPLIKRCFFWPLLALFSFVNASAGNLDNQDFGIDTLKRHLELGLHEQLVARKIQPGSVLAGFTTDGCSGGLSVGWKYLAGKIHQFQATHGIHPAWESCCFKHDRAYHTGGGREITPVKGFEARREADLELKACVLETGVKRTPELSAKYNLSTQEVETLYSVIADLMYRAVRIGGMPCTGLPWRWGYGWPECE